MAKALKLQLVTPDRTIFEGEVDELTAPGEVGPFTILINHTPIVSALVPGTFRYRFGKGEENFVLGGGFLEFHENQATVLASSAEKPEQIDLDRAERSRQRAEQRLQHAVDGTIDYDRARASRDRAKARITAAQQATTGRR
ncbi:MAG: F0F1 ATP synthase subunit epsilon [Bacteroidota bacterium]|nr:F0F1 ATP synthase subunit epsilon [Bacteroidota bacterium]MDP4232163.1 F0F1 ATP synthase subunit epsilon [Bacteroidota bacterium]MDP4241129.1 F0F1 ATP synthase subunit epsilon [Bacteroidota bacterium]MDP4286521.1 F0F1 ATP synthase subunit epsilon [Bacteroidota bacterium]